MRPEYSSGPRQSQPSNPREHAARAEEEHREPSATRKIKKRILVVDDETVVRGILAGTFRKLGYEVTEAANADKAVKAFLYQSFDLITLDIALPGMSGLDFHRVLSQEFGVGKRIAGAGARKLPPILFITGFAERTDVAGGQFGEGIVGVLAKPFDIDTLVRTVHGILEDGSLDDNTDDS
ncbi:MAG: response regulator [Planctomycetota bacterium]|jgi:two-component system phosphate regulon response regulator PhoB